MPVLPRSAEELLTTTRTVRKRLDLERPVDLALVREALTVALQAPSGSNAQSWHFVVVTDADKRAAIGEHYRQAVEQYLASDRSAARLHADDPERAPVQHRVGDSVAHLGHTMGRVPVLVLPCLRLPGGLPRGSQAGVWGSLHPAAWSYMLAARLRGLGTAWTTLHLQYEREVAALLDLPPDVYQGALVPTAHYVGDTFSPAPRQPLDQVLHLDGW
jgi:nitroreductase